MYEQLGKSDAPAVTLNVVLVFLIPILIFIFTLAVCKKYFELEASFLNALLSVIIAVFTTFVYILLARVIVRRRVEKMKKRICSKGD